jgi:hypothetical protein
MISTQAGDYKKYECGGCYYPGAGENAHEESAVHGHSQLSIQNKHATTINSQPQKHSFHAGINITSSNKEGQYTG